MQNDDLIEGIKKGGVQHDRSLSVLYKNRNIRDSIFRYLKSKGVNNMDCNTIWTDAVIQFAKLVKNGKYENQGNLTGYMHNLSKYIFLNLIRKNDKYRHVEIDEKNTSDLVFDSIPIYQDELKRLLSNQLDKLGNNCKEILMLWSRDYSMDEILKKLNIVSNEAVRKRKHICLKKLLQSIEANKELKTQLKQYLV